MLKQYIFSLIEAVFGKKKTFIAHQALPSNTSIMSNESSNSYIATNDGYLRFLVKTTDTQNPWFNVDVYNGISTYLPALSFIDGTSSFSIPVKKGDNISFKTAGCEVQTMTLLKLEGGG